MPGSCFTVKGNKVEKGGATIPQDGQDSTVAAAAGGQQIRWVQAHSAYVKVRLVHSAAIFGGVFATCGVFTAAAQAYGWALWVLVVCASGVVVSLLWGAWWMLTTPRRTRALGYCLEPDHLMVRRGLLFRRLTWVPYGRLQYADLNSGPLERRFGLHRLTIRTAGAGTAGRVTIYGLGDDAAAGLHRELIRRADERMAAL